MTLKEALQELQQYQGTPSHQVLMAMLEAQIDELRRKNDTATAEEVKGHQGAIRELKRIQKAIKPTTTAREYDGAYMD